MPFAEEVHSQLEDVQTPSAPSHSSSFFSPPPSSRRLVAPTHDEPAPPSPLAPLTSSSPASNSCSAYPHKLLPLRSEISAPEQQPNLGRPAGVGPRPASAAKLLFADPMQGSELSQTAFDGRGLQHRPEALAESPGACSTTPVPGRRKLRAQLRRTARWGVRLLRTPRAGEGEVRCYCLSAECGT